MDKLGPICRSVEDCALVLDAIHGPDGQDRTVAQEAAFNWNANFDWRKLRVGYLKKDFELAAAWANSRTLRLADGPDEVHRESVAKIELKKHGR